MMNQIGKHVNRFVLFALAALCLAWSLSAGSALAQSGTSAAGTAQGTTPPVSGGNDQIGGKQVKGFDRFLDKHPGMREQLEKNPNLVDDKEFLDKHPELRQYLKNHPTVREELKKHPHKFMKREERQERNEQRHHRRHPKK